MSSARSGGVAVAHVDVDARSPPRTARAAARSAPGATGVDRSAGRHRRHRRMPVRPRAATTRATSSRGRPRHGTAGSSRTRACQVNLTIVRIASSAHEPPTRSCCSSRPRRGGNGRRRRAPVPGRVGAAPGRAASSSTTAPRDATAARGRRRRRAVVRASRRAGLGAASAPASPPRSALDAVAVAFCDADGEYAPEELAALVAPILAGDADYVVGSRFRRHDRPDASAPPSRQPVLTVALAALARAPITDGQSGYRALSPAAAPPPRSSTTTTTRRCSRSTSLRKGFRYAEVPISLPFREHGRSFVRLAPYLRTSSPRSCASCAAGRACSARSVSPRRRGWRKPSRARGPARRVDVPSARRRRRPPTPSRARGACCRARTGPGDRSSAARGSDVAHVVERRERLLVADAVHGIHVRNAADDDVDGRRGRELAARRARRARARRARRRTSAVHVSSPSAHGISAHSTVTSRGSSALSR